MVGESVRDERNTPEDNREYKEREVKRAGTWD